ncbi:glycogen debranching N-terminal domain-containing protein [Micromonospora polyrhachis]|uniref:Glycogen debranching enzyme n=1 Tax=Micromonospora polyrhachis TaxID=1282883 RepID=A0A7W7WSF3_9ACTN|nr:amylo-alpha-1,6-glucosidase [Micromonospora polyrhachis]MBB4961592.1 glycogen debranching enzyme [Micromonospora polyrhachis]
MTTDDLVSIIDGSSFVVSDRRGDIDATPSVPTGMFLYDTRFLSKWHLTVNGERLNSLSVDDVQYFETRFFLVPGEPTHYVDAKVSIIRQRTIGGSFSEHLTVLNHKNEPIELTIRMEAASDFADLFEIKDIQHKKGQSYVRVENGLLRLGYQRESFRRETLISASEPAQFDEDGLTFRVRIEPHGSWETDLRVDTRVEAVGGRDIREGIHQSPAWIKTSMQEKLEDWLANAPTLNCDSEALATCYRRSLVDLAALRYQPLGATGQTMPAAGLPWFMALFGRDSIITSFQALPFIPELAHTTLRVLALLIGTRLDDFRDEEPGKILHEMRNGESAAFEEQPHSPYYGSADSTPLFLILLDEYERWTGDGGLVRELETDARAALHWIDEYGDILGNGYIWYERRNTRNGLENQCWKDSWDGVSYRDGRLPPFPRATCELQGYAYAAKLRCARLARRFWNDPALAQRLEREAAELKERFHRDFWVADGEYYALALDIEGRPVDALSSNMGHLLWSGIVDQDRAGKIAEHLIGPRLFSGWGVRTLAEGEGRFNPVGYHVGTVWPFDNSIIAAGLRRYGFAEEAGLIAESMIDAAQFFHGRLPEAFAGYDRALTKYPVQYPTACSPQAWSAGTPLALLWTLLGLQPCGEHLVVIPALPEQMGRIELLNIPGRWGHADAFARGQAGKPDTHRHQSYPV